MNTFKAFVKSIRPCECVHVSVWLEILDFPQGAGSLFSLDLLHISLRDNNMFLWTVLRGIVRPPDNDKIR